MTAVSPMIELTDLILEIGGADLLRCMQCGTCTGVCPWPPVKEFSPRQLIRLASLGLEGYEQEDLWNCVTCGSCVIRCPRGIDLVDVMRAARAVMLEAGTSPETYRQPMASLRSDGNPWAGERKERQAWAAGLDLPQFSAEHAYLLFTCCTQAYDARNRKAAQALARLLLGAEVSFGVLDQAESCCGDQARKIGVEDLYEDLKGQNTGLFKERKVRQIICASPHCLQTFNTDYSKELPLRAFHYTQVLRDLLQQEKLTLSTPLEGPVTYHDPCYLGRHAGEYEAPREVLRAIPGLELREMPRNRETSLCCGGGGGGLWRDVPKEQRFAVLRVQEALDTGAKIIATACPYCTVMLEDAVRILDAEETIAVKDIAELVAASAAPKTE